MSSTSLAGQPKPFYLIFFIEMWERFGYYGLQTLLILYMVQKLGFSDTHTDIFFAAFSALVWLLPTLGGFVGDKVLGTKRTILLGAIILGVGYLLLSLPGTSTAPQLALPLSVIAIGNALFKANPSSLLSKVYEQTGHNIDSGFTLYYMAINMGCFLSMASMPLVSHYFGWHAAFLMCCVGMVIALVNFFLMRHTIEDFGSKPDQQPLCAKRLFGISLVTVALGVACWILLKHYNVIAPLLTFGAITLLLIYFTLIARAQPEERGGMWLFIILFAQAIIFFVLYFQMPMSLTLFALRNVEHSILFGLIPVSAAQFQMFSPFWIMTLSPLLALMYRTLHRHKRDLSIPAKFSFGTLLIGFSFLLLPIGAIFSQHGVIASGWMVLMYALEGASELLVSALGMSLAARYVPQRFMGFTMGLWFLCPSIASIFAGKVAAIASVPKSLSADPVQSLPIYSHLFTRIGFVTIAVSVVMFVLVPLLKRLAYHDHQAAARDEGDADIVTELAV